MTLLNIDFPRTHDLTILARRLPREVKLTSTLEELDRMTEYAITSRYPGDYEVISLAEARKAVQIARQIRQAIRRQLPRVVLRPLVSR